jgi:hypothetical protein
MVKSGISMALAAGVLALAFSTFAINSADARVFKGGSSQRVGSVNPADPGPITVPVPNTHGGGGAGGGGGGGKRP